MKLLLAEDDAHIREGLVEVLSAEGYHVIEARDGREALERFEAESPDLALLDIMMPGIDGYEVCRELLRRRPELPILFVSARSEEIDHVLGLELGADDFITKPFGVREVIARIRAVTRRTIARTPRPADGWDDDRAPFVLGDLEVRPAELRAYRSEASIDLSLRDLAILRLLHRERGNVVRRDQFFDECWGYEHMPRSRTLDQHISKLRRRIELDPAEPLLIRTVHGVGYRYE